MKARAPVQWVAAIGVAPAFLNEIALMTVNLLHLSASHLSALKFQHWEGVMHESIVDSSEQERLKLGPLLSVSTTIFITT